MQKKELVEEIGKLNVKIATSNKELEKLELEYKKKKLEHKKYKNEKAGLQLKLQELELKNSKKALSDKEIKQIQKRTVEKYCNDSVNGIDIRTIKELLGHVQIDTTEIYTHLYDKEVMDVMLEHPLAQFKMENALAFCA